MSSSYKIITGYKILHLINEIGNLSYFRAVRETDGKPVIIKMFKPDNISAAEWSRCKQEYEIICKLKDIEGVIRAYDIEVHQDYPVIILEDFGGESLKLFLDRRIRTGQGILPLNDFFNIAVQITHVLSNIHAVHVIHNDINPDNIIYTKSDVQIKIVGFHISTTMREYPAIRNPGRIEGTLAYISPEQTGRMNRIVDYRSDLYSLGATFYEMLTGSPPFESNDPLILVHAHIAKTPCAVSALNPAIPPILSDIVMRLLAKNAEDRYQSAYGLDAADLANGTAAFSSAQIYLERALALMPDDAWINHYNIMLRIHLQLAYALSLTGDFEHLERILQSTENNARTIADTARVRQAKIHAVIASGSSFEVVDLGLSLIKDLGVSISRNPSPEEAINYLRETAELFTEDRINSLRDLPDASTEAGLIFETAMIINASVYITNIHLSLVFISRIARLCFECGLAPWAITRLVTFAQTISSILHDIQKTRLLTNAAMQLYKEKYPSYNFIPYLNLSIGLFISHRYEHLKHTLPVVEEGAQKGLTTGAFSHACTCWLCHAWHNLFLGAPLENVEKDSLQAMVTCRKVQMDWLVDYILLVYQATLNLQGKSKTPWILKSDIYNEDKMLKRSLLTNDFGDAIRILFYKAWLLYLFGLKKEAFDLFRESESYLLITVAGTYVIPLIYFYDTLVNAAVFDFQNADEQARILERIYRNLKEFEVWVRNAPMNHQHKKDLMEAETFFEKAIQGARDNEFLNEEALSFELLAEFYISHGSDELARINMTKAHDCYSCWQAWAKVQDIEKRYPQWFVKVPVSSKKSALEYLRSLDLRSVMKASQAISGRIILEELLIELLGIVIENAGAQKGCLILEKEGKWVIEAERSTDLRDMTTLQAIGIEESNAVCASIVRYVIRSHESIVLDDAEQDGLFVDDEYIKQKQIKSVLCMPLLNRGRLIGILYLENNLAAGVFTPERIEMLELLAGQAAIALENAMLYQQAQEEIAERKLAEMALRESEER